MCMSLINCLITDPGVITTSMDFVNFNICNICKIKCPPRTRHCQICNACVMIMDHHCPWMGNCIGIHNHKLFLLFCGYTSLSCFIEGFAFIPRIIQIYGEPEADDVNNN